MCGPDTSDVVIESAHFDPVLLRRTATRLGLKTDAVYRYERGVDPLLSPRGANRVAELLVKYGGGMAESGLTTVGTPELPADIQVTGEQVRGLLGMHIGTGEMVDILTRLGAKVQHEGDTLTVTPPTWRVDMVVWQDLAEEVARLHGYAELPETLPTFSPHPDNHGAGAVSAARRSLKGALAGLGAQEVVTYTFTSDSEAEQARSEAPSVRLQNPLTAERTGLRTALYPSLLKAAQNRPKGERALLFEIGRIFPASGETEKLGLLLRGPLAPTTHQAGVAGSFAAFKGLVESLAAGQGARSGDQANCAARTCLPRCTPASRAQSSGTISRSAGWAHFTPRLPRATASRATPTCWKSRCRCPTPSGPSATPAALPPPGATWPSSRRRT